MYGNTVIIREVDREGASHRFASFYSAESPVAGLFTFWLLCILPIHFKRTI